MNVRIRNIIRIICFVLIFVILFPMVSDTLSPKNYQWKNFRGFYSEERDSLDLVYIGGSACYMSWVPYTAWENSGYTSYALGTSSFMSFAYMPLVKEVLAYQNPQFLIIDARPFVYTYSELSGCVTSGITFINSLKAYSTNRLTAALKCYEIYKQVSAAGEWTGGEETIGSMLFDVERFHGFWNQLDRSFFAPDADERQYNYSKGFYGVKENKELELTDNSDIKTMRETNADALADLTDLLDYLDEKNIKALFVVAPSKETADQKEEYNYLASVIENRGYGFLDANDYTAEIGLDESTDYYDGNHLNIYGAEKYTLYLTKYVKNTYGISASHSANIENQWAEGSLKWNDIAIAIKNGKFSAITGEYIIDIDGDNDE